jgi:hypothetical protein
MVTCSVVKNLEIVRGTRADYEALAQYHYREGNLGPVAAIYALKHGQSQTLRDTDRHRPKRLLAGASQCSSKHESVYGVIVYSMPTAGARMRNIATGGIFAGLERIRQLKLINKNIRTISRVIIEPRFRSLGLAVRLVKETMPMMGVPFIEALAVMGRANPFFEKAGLTRYDAGISVSRVRLIEAFSAVGIEEEDLTEAEVIQQKLDSYVTPSAVEGSVKIDSSTRLCLARNDSRDSAAEFIESEMARFLKSYGQRRYMKPGIERTRFILNRLADSPVYYQWKNPNIGLRT